MPDPIPQCRRGDRRIAVPAYLVGQVRNGRWLDSQTWFSDRMRPKCWVRLWGPIYRVNCDVRRTGLFDLWPGVCNHHSGKRKYHPYAWFTSLEFRSLLITVLDSQVILFTNVTACCRCFLPGRGVFMFHSSVVHDQSLAFHVGLRKCTL